MATAAGYEWSCSPSTHSPDISSPHYPDRPIRPLPRRRLRSRLSPDQADAIIYPLVPPYASSAFYPSSANFDKVVSTTRTRYDNPPSCNCGGDHSELESEDDDGERVDRRQSLQGQQRHNRGSVLASAYERWGSPFSKGQQPDSASSSADGYESFENTNNKKKRKIPLSGLTTSHVALAADMANMGINSPSGESTPNGGGLVGQYYGTGTSAIPASSTGTGISGAGRGRFGRAVVRSSIDRKPLGASTSGLNTHSLGSTGRTRRDWNGGLHEGVAPTDHGIISAAIANAAEQPVTPQKGKENVSLLQQHGSNSTPQKTQFTFTCESDSSNKMTPWPSGLNGSIYSPSSAPPSLMSSSYNALQGRSRRGMATHGTQTSPRINETQIAAAQAAQTAPNIQSESHAASQPPKKMRPRKPGRGYALAAKQRRLQQEYNNYQHPPSRDEIWICEFCEYESIFGSPPEALIRQYEIKDRKEMKRQAEKRRLLEKAKMKGRKGKKNGKNSKGTNNATAQGQNAQSYDQGADPLPLDPADVQQGDEYYDDEFDDFPVPTSTPQPPAAIGTGTTTTNGNHLDAGLHSGKLDSPGNIAPNGHIARNKVVKQAS